MAQVTVEITEKQKKARVAFLYDRIQKITNELANPASTLHELYSAKNPKKDLIIAWAEYLEELHQLGEFKQPVNSISTYIQAELRKIGLESATDYARHVLSFKYKDSHYDHSKEDDDGGYQNRENSSISFEKENQEYIKLIDDTIEYLRFVKKQLYTKSFVKYLDPIELDEFITVHSNTLDIGRNIFNDKRKDLVQTQSALVEVMMHATSTHSAGEYLVKVKDMFEFTGKQALKILKGEIQNLHPLYDPQNRLDATRLGFYGQRCDHCGSYRVKRIPTESIGKYRVKFHVKISEEWFCYCYACKQGMPAKTERIIIKKKK